MTKLKKSNLRLKIVLFVAFLATATLMSFLLENRKNHSRERHLQLITERYQFAYNTIYDQYRRFATNVSGGIIERYHIVSIYQQLQTADQEKKNRLRSQLLADTRARYERLKKEGDVRQLHFHLRNNESFLRLHRPEKYGDNLTGIRETVSYVNTVKLPIDGFEEGKVFNGFRFGFPFLLQIKPILAVWKSLSGRNL